MSTVLSSPLWTLSGSHLLTGQPLYLWIEPQGELRQWRGHVSQATPISDNERDLWMQRAQQDARASLVVDPYWIKLDASTGEPERRREQMRVNGPSVRPDLPAASRLDTAPQNSTQHPTPPQGD